MHDVIAALGLFVAGPHHLHLTAWDKELSGYVASALVLASFCMQSMRWLRVAAVGSNVCFIFFAAVSDIHPVLVLHSVLLPVNLTRLWQLRRARVEAQRLLEAADPAGEPAQYARPRFLSQVAAADPGSALPLAEREQQRVVHLLVCCVPSEAAAVSGIAPAEAITAPPQLLAAIDRFLAALVASNPSEQQLAWAGGLHSRNEVLRELHETLAGIAPLIPPAGRAVAADVARVVAEGLGALLLHADAAARQETADDVDLLIRTTEDRSELVEQIRQRAIADAAIGDRQELQRIFALTSLYERAVWLLHRYAVLLQNRGLPPARDLAARDTAFDAVAKTAATAA